MCWKTSWVQRGFWTHEAVSCDGICLDPSCPRITDQLEPTSEVEGGRGKRKLEREWGVRECSAKQRHPGFNWKHFDIFPKWNNRETGNAITPTKKCVKQVASSLATQSHSSVMNSSCSQRTSRVARFTKGVKWSLRAVKFSERQSSSGLVRAR